MYEGVFTVLLDELVWQSDWNGDEVGFDDVDVVGLYRQERFDELVYYFYIDMADNVILDFWCEPEE